MTTPAHDGPTARVDSAPQDGPIEARFFSAGPPENDQGADVVRFAGKPVTEWSYVEWEAYRLRCENDELRAEVAKMTGPKEAQRHAIRWSLIVGMLGVDFVLALALTATLSIVFWVLFAAEAIGLIAYGLIMDNYRSSLRREKKRST